MTQPPDTEDSNLTTEPVKRPPLALQSVDNIERCNGLPLSVLSVCDRVADDTLEERLQNTSCLLVDHCMEWSVLCVLAGQKVLLTGGDTLDTATAGKTPDRWLGDALDVVTKNLAVTLRTTLAEALATFAA
jgi:hypothetical protein